MLPIHRIIALFGGLSAMARALGHRHASRVQGWRDRGAIPARQVEAVLEAARRLGLPLSPADLGDAPGAKSGGGPRRRATRRRPEAENGRASPHMEASMSPDEPTPDPSETEPAAAPRQEPGGTDARATDARICHAALAIAARAGWRAVNLRAVAAEAGLDPAALRPRFPSRWHIIARHAALADAAATAGLGPPDPADSIRDRLFDILMRRFDALNQDRDGVLAVARALRADPLAAAGLLPVAMQSMAFLLEAAGSSAAGPVGALRAKGLLGVWLAAFRAWQHDDSPDLSATMAALDHALARAEGPARLLARLEGLAGGLAGGIAGARHSHGAAPETGHAAMQHDEDDEPFVAPSG